MKDLYFIRHGQSISNANNRWGGRNDSPLTELGMQQAQKTAQSVKAKHLRFDIIVSSPLMRAYNTALTVAQAINYPVQNIVQNALFVERSFGELEGTINQEASVIYLQDESLIQKYESVESMDMLQARANKALGYLRTLPQDTVLLVGHGAFMRALRRAIAGEPIGKRGKVLNNAELEKLI